MSNAYMDGFAIYPDGSVRKGYCRKTAVTNVAVALERLQRDLPAYVATQTEVDQVLALRKTSSTAL